MQLTIPDSVLQSMRLPDPQIEQELLKQLAIALYRKSMLSFDAARELAQMECHEFGQIVGEKNLTRRCHPFDTNGNLVYSCSE